MEYVAFLIERYSVVIIVCLFISYLKIKDVENISLLLFKFTKRKNTLYF